jgi:Lrp/AsnC family leucine-responsive transcriptional regulator
MAPTPIVLDDTDWEILRRLHASGRLSFRQLARQVHLSPAAVTARVHALEAAGVITGYRAEIDPARIGRTVHALVRLSASSSTSRSVERAEELVSNHPAVRAVHLLLGDSDLALVVEATSLEELDQLVTTLGELGRTTTNLIVRTRTRQDPAPSPGHQPGAGG